MTTPGITNSQLKTLSNQDNLLNNLYYNDRLQKLGLQEKLGEIYTPLTTGMKESSKNIQSKIAETSQNIVNKIEESKPAPPAPVNNSEITNKLNEIKFLLSNFPNVIAHLIGDKSIPLSESDREVVQTLDELPEEDKKEIVSEFKENVDMEEVLAGFFNDDRNIIDPILLNRRKQEELVKYAASSNVKYPKMSPKFRAVAKYWPDFIDQVISARDEDPVSLEGALAKEKRKKKGTGIKFLPSDSKDLVTEMNRLLGSYVAGNKNTFNEISAISDVLRKRGLITPEMNKKIFKYMKLH